MDSLGGQPIQQTVWYNYGSYNDILVNHPGVQVQVAVPTVQMVAAPAQPPTPDPLEVEEVQHTELPLNIIPLAKARKPKKPPPELQERNFHCQECGSSFTNSSNLRSHMRIHSGVRPYVCEQCGKSFIQSSNLKAHKRVHTGERPYQCSECGQTFSRSSHLVGHKRTHTGERPYICGICSEAFFTSSHLRNHVRRHTGEKPYICQYCGDAFGQSVELRVHLRYHTGEKPFKCRECDTAMVSAKELKAHRKVHHLGSKPFVCELCDKSFRTQTFLSKHSLRCKGPRPKRPKGRPRKYPRADGEEPPWRKPKKRKNKILAAPTDRVSRSRSKAIVAAQLKREEDDKPEAEAENPQHGKKSDKQTKAKNVENVSDESEVLERDSDQDEDPMAPRRFKPEIDFPDEHNISELPMVQVMLDNLDEADGLDATHPQTLVLQTTAGAMHSLHSLSELTEHQIGVMDLSGQQIHQDDNVEQQTRELMSGHEALPLVSAGHQHQLQVITKHQLPVVSAHQQPLNSHQPLITATNHHQVLSSHQQLPIINAHKSSTVANGHQQTLSHHHQQPLSHPQVAVVTAHQQTSHTHLPAVTAHRQLNSTQQQLPLVSAHQQSVGAAHQPIAVLAAHQHVPAHEGLIVAAHQQVPVVSAHQQPAVTAHQQVPVVSAHQAGPVVTAHQTVPVVSGHKPSSRLGAGGTSTVVYEAGQPFVVDLSSPALASQVSLVNQTVASPQYTRP